MLLEDNKKNVIVSVSCGFAFGLSWWLMIDVFSYYPEAFAYRSGLLILPAFFGAVSLIGNNLIPNSSLVENDALNRKIICHRMLFFFTMAFGFSGLLASIIMSATAEKEDFPMYARIGLPIHNTLLLLSNVVFKFATTDGTEDLF